MTRTEHLLTILAEECAELSQRATKALRFGIHEVQPGQDESNADRMRAELADLKAVYDMLMPDGLEQPSSAEMAAKKAKVEKFLEYSRLECGTLEG